ncbi:MAG: hypothetical protein AAGF12_37110 [Myxococcota bacterium]
MTLENIINIDDASEEPKPSTGHIGHAYKVLTPAIDKAGGTLGVNATRVSPGKVSVPFHCHRFEDEALKTVGRLEKTRYLSGEPDPPRLLAMAKELLAEE